MNYKLVVDENELDKFIDFLPELSSDECYYICLMSRKKYDNDNGFDKIIAKNVVNNKKFIKNYIKRMEVKKGLYEVNTNDGVKEIRQESLAVYITINPRSMKKAKHLLLKNLIDEMYSSNENKTSLLSQTFKFLSTSNSKNRYIDYDFDLNKDDINLNELINEIVQDTKLGYEYFSFISTRGGYHLLVDLNLMKKNKIRNNWMKPLDKILKKYSSDEKRSGKSMTPIPGTYQGGYTPRLIR